MKSSRREHKKRAGFPALSHSENQLRYFGNRFGFRTFQERVDQTGQ